MWPFKSKLDEFGRSDLHYAARDGDSRQCESLIHKGLDVNLPDKNGWTPLHFAAQAQAPEVVSLLLHAGAQVDPKDVHGNTPLFKAVFESQGRGDTIMLLRAQGADALSVNKHGQTPVGLARLIGNYNVKQYFEDLPCERRTSAMEATAGRCVCGVLGVSPPPRLTTNVDSDSRAVG